MQQETTFDEACSMVQAALEGSSRHLQVADLARSAPFSRALGRLRGQIRSNGFDRFLSALDHRTRQDGFHVLHDWDGKADRVNPEIIPVDVLDYLIAERGTGPTEPRALAILLDYYYFHVLSLLSLRIWDAGTADENLERLSHLLDALQGPNGSGQRFVANAETLILIATSHFEVVERGYDRLLRRVKTLSPGHQAKIALGHASSMGSHLRFGFEATYGRDTSSMRADNVADYPWLSFALSTLMREYAGIRDERPADPARDAVIEAMLNGLSADARAFVGEPPRSLSSCDAERLEFRDRYLEFQVDLRGEFEGFRPRDGAYSPLAFFFNFSHNVLKGTIVDALLRAEPWPVAFNDLLGRAPEGDPRSTDRETLARTLMDYARRHPDRIGGRMMPVIVYDPRAGQRAFRVMMEKLAPSP